MSRSLRHILLALACLALCGTLLAACGDDDEQAPASARQLLNETFGSGAAAIDNGKLAASLRLDPKGLLALGGPIELTLDGPFAAPAKGDPPRFDVDFAATLAREVFRGNVLSTGKGAYVRMDGTSYAVDDAFVSDLRKGLGAASSGKQRGLHSLGIDPLRWLSHARTRGEERIAGVDTTRISADVNVARLLADVDRLLTKVGGSGAGDLLSPRLRQQITAAVKSAKADIWTGSDDRILRQLTARIEFAFKDGASPISGLDAGVIDLRLRLTGVNATKLAVQAPSDSRPLSELTGGGIGNFIAGIGRALTGTGSAFAGGALLQCITGADGKTSSLVRCVSDLAD